MESHPVPQNVTAFEFHLIGNMTMRQFGYLAVGLIIAYVSFLLFFNTLPLLAWPLIIIPSVVGAAYAFLPIMERPLDYWTKAFIKAIRRPTFRKYSSKTVSPEDPKFKERLEIYLHYIQALPQKSDKPSSITLHPTPISEEKSPNVPSNPLNNPDQPPGHDPVGEFMQNLSKLAQDTSNYEQPKTEISPVSPSPQPPPPTPAPPKTQALPSTPSSTPPFTQEPSPSEEELDKTVSLAREAQLVQNRILLAEKEINEIKSGAATKGVDPKRYTQQFQSVLGDLQKLNQKAREISHDLAELSKTQNTSSLSSQPVAKPNIIPTLTLTSTPNIINGIVTDAQGNYIEGAIIVAHDKAGLPVRALKTNKLGQFIAATPLPSETYTISVEKDDLGFDVIQLDLTDKVLNPIVISAKKGAQPS